jgi:HSP20 family molecular chaperone IbpA
VKYLFFFILLFNSSFSYAQKSHDELIQEFLNQRKNMMEEVMKAFDDDSFFEDDFDNKNLFDQIRKQGFKDFNGFNKTGKNIKVEEKIERDGTILILITPANDNVKLDIETTETLIKIKSETMEKLENKKNGNVSSSSSRSSYTQSISIPRGFKAQAPSQKGKTIKIALIPNKANAKIFYPKVRKNDKKPIGKRAGEGTI